MTGRDRRLLRTYVLEELIRLEDLVAVLDDAAGDAVGDQIATMLREALADLTTLRAMQRRIEESGFGECEHCREFIGVERLIALPDSIRCMRCTGRVER